MLNNGKQLYLFSLSEHHVLDSKKITVGAVINFRSVLEINGLNILALLCLRSCCVAGCFLLVLARFYTLETAESRICTENRND